MRRFLLSIRSIEKNLIVRLLLISLISSCVLLNTAQAANRFSVSGGTGNWNSNTNWSATSGGSSGASFPVAGDVVVIEGGVNITVNVASACGNITVSNGSTLTVNNNLTINNGSTVTINGAVVFNSSAFFTGGGGGSNGVGLAINSGASLTTANTGGFVTSSTSAGSIRLNHGNKGHAYNDGVNYVYNGTANQVLGSAFTENTPGNLTIDNTGSAGSNTVSLSATSTISGDLTITAGILDATTSNFGLSVGGTWSNNGTFTARTGTVTLNGGSNQSIEGSASTTFNNLTLNNSMGATLNTNATVNATLTLTSGSLDLDANVLTMGSAAPAISGTFSATRMIIADGGGEIRKACTSTATAAYTFPIGDASSTSEYSPLAISSVAITAGTFTSSYIGVKVTDAKHTSNKSATNFLTRYWSVTQSGITGSSALTATVVGTYTAGTPNGADVSGAEASVITGQLNGSLIQLTNPWIKFSALASNKITATGAMLTNNVASIFTGITSAAPTVSATGGGSVCTGTPVTLTASGSGDPSFLYSWSNSLGTNATATPSTSATGSTTYTVTAYDGNGLTATSTSTVVVNIIPSVAGIGGAFTKTCASNPTGATIGEANQAGNTYAWTPSAELSATNISNPTANPTITTTYTVTKTATAGGCTPTATVVVTVNTTAPSVDGIGGAFTKTCTSNTSGAAIGETAEDGNTYAWSPSAGLSSATVSNPTANPTTTTTYTVVKTTTANGCTASATVTVTVNTTAPSVAGIGGAFTKTCISNVSGATIGETPVGGNTYAWTPVEGLSSTTVGNPTANPTATTTYTVVKTTTANGCTSSATVTVTVNTTVPTVNAGSAFTKTCVTNPNGAAIGESAEAGNTYAWSPSSGLSSTTTSNPTANPTVTTTYTVVKTTTANGCTTSGTVTVTVNTAAPSVSAGSPFTITCVSNTSGAQIGEADDASATYVWSPSAGLSATNISDPVANPTATTTYTVTKTATANGCTATATVTVTVNTTAPSADITNNTGTTVLTCATTSVSVTTTGGVSYAWDGGASTATAANSFTSPGTYTVVVTGSNGCTASSSIIITQDITAPTAGITNNTGTTVLTCATTSISVTATGGVSYAWDGGTSTVTDANSFTSPGSYTVTATAANGCTDDESIVIAQDISTPTAVITNNTGTSILTCTTPSISVTASGGVSYAWDGGTSTGTAANSFTSPGTYSVIVTAANGCTDDETIIITQDITVTAGITNNTGTTVLTCATTSISVTATGGVSYAWDGGTSTNTAANSFDAPGTYTVVVTAANGCTDDETIVITQNIAVTAGITNNTGTTVLTCATTSISVTATGDVSYAWDGGNSTNTAANSFDAPGTYTVVVTAANGCTDDESIVITQNITTPTAGITNNTGTTVLTCATTSISVTATGGVSYAWDGGTSTNTTGNSFTASGTYTVVVTAANGCTDEESIVIIQDVTTPTAGITNNSGTTELTCLVTSISVTATGGVSYTWDGGTSTNTAANSFNAPGTYTVVVTAANGCTDDESIIITQDIAVTTGITNNTGTTILTCAVTSINVTATGGVSYAWDGGTFTNTAANSFDAPGTYTVVVTAANGCTDEESIVITQNVTAPTAGITNNTGTTILTCAVTSISVTTTGGVSYTWDGGTSTNTAANSFDAPGTYTVIVTAANGCTDDESIVITQNITAPTVGITNNTGTTILTCAVTSISVTATGGVSYAWDGGTSTNTAANSFDAPGTYTVVVTAANGCTDDESIVITQNITAPTAGITNNTGNTVLTCTTTSINVTGTGGVSYAWDGGTSTATAANSFTAPGTYTVIITAANGCTDDESIVITQDIAVTAGITNNTGATVLTCAVTSISVTATGGVSYAWDGGTSTNTAANSFDAPGTYTVVVTAANGCTDEESIIITQDIAVTAGITNNSGTTVLTCALTSINVTATGGVSYAWDGGTSSNTAANSFTAPGTYTVAVTAANGCTDDERIVITQNITTPTAGITNNTGTTILTCNTPSISVTATGGVSYAWDGGAAVATAANSFTAPSTYTVIVTAANGCTEDESIVITQDIAVTAGITNNSGTTVLTCAITSISVTATGGVSYAWGGGTSTNTAANSFDAPGTYTVAVTAANGCTDVESIIITQNIAVTAGITNNTGTTVLTCAVTSISVTATGGVSYAWDGGTSTNTAANSFDAQGTYTVVVTAANGCTDDESIVITQNIVAPAAGITNNTGTTVLTCATTTINVTATGGVSYAWDGGTSANTAANSFTAPGTYTVIVTAANGCTASSGIVITQNITAPVAGITNNTGTTVLTCATTSISVTATGGVSYAWDGGTSTNTAANSFTAPGTYTVVVTAANGCTDDESIVITQNITTPTAGITNNTGTTVLTCNTTSINATATGGVSYAWDGGTSTSTAANSFNAPGTYTVVVTAANGCTDNESIIITQDIAVTTGITNNSGTTILTCAITSINVTATGGVTYVWDGGTSTNTAANSFNAPGTYTVVVTAANGCTDEESIVITQNITAPTAGITNNTGTTVLTCTTTSISVTATGGVSYAWDGGTSTNTAVNSLTAPGTYTVIVTAANGCTSSSSIIITQNITAPSLSAGSAFIKTCTSNASGATIGEANDVTATYAWSPSAGLSSVTVSNPTANPTVTTTYTVIKTTTANGCTSAASVTVTVNTTAPTVSAGSPFTKTCVTNPSGAAIGETNDATATYAWSPSAGLSSTTVSDPTANPTITTTYTVVKTRTDNGCTSVASVTVTVNTTAPSVSAGSAFTKTCTANTSGAAIGESAVAGNTYAWSPSAGLSSATVSNPTANPTVTTTYTVTKTTTTNGCTATASVTVTVNTAAPSASISPSGSLNVCSPAASELLTANTNGASPAYQWIKNGTNIGGANSPTFSATTDGSYTVRITASNGCTNTSSATVLSFYNSPSANASATLTSVCQGSQTSLSSTGSSNTFDTPKTFTASPNATIPNNGSIISTITVSGAPATMAAITNISVKINATHDNLADLELYLQRPGGTLSGSSNGNFARTTSAGGSISLIADRGGNISGSLTNTIFSDAAVNSISTGSSPFTNSYIPENAFSTLITGSANPNGIWTLTAVDDQGAGGNTGTLNSWSITMDCANGVTYSWSSNDGFSSSVQNPGLVTPGVTPTTTYTVTVTDTITGCSSQSSLNVNVSTQGTTANAGSNQNLCNVTTATLAGNTATIGTGVWTRISGSGTVTIPGSPTSGITGLAVGNNVFQWTITNGACSTSSQVTIHVDAAATVANAGSNQNLCSTTTATLGGNTPSVGTGGWTLVSGSGTVTTPGSPTSGVTGLAVGNNVFQWIITNGTCSSSSQVTIHIDAAVTVSNAGSNQNMCNVTTASLAANTPSVGTGTWTRISGSGTAITPNDPNSGISGLAVGNNVFQWTITNGTCSSSSQVTIHIDAPVTSNAGPDQNLCNTTTTTLAGNTPTAGSGAWTRISGSGTVTTPGSPTSGVTGLAVGDNVFLWFIINGTCSSSSQVTIHVDAPGTTAHAGSNQNLCNVTTTTLSGNTASVGTGSWSVISGGGSVISPSIASSGVTGLTIGDNIFQWTITNGACSTSSQVTIHIDTPPTASNAGSNQTLCNTTTTTLGGNTPSTGTGTWTLVSGSGNITSPNDPESQVTFLAIGDNVFEWTITNGACSSSSQVIIHVNSATTAADAGPYQTGLSTCGSTQVTLAANDPLAGTGEWSIVSGTGGSFGNSSLYNSTFSGTAGEAYTLRWTITNGPCASSADDVNVTFNLNPTTANAGTDQTGSATCGVTEVTLNANNPTVGTGAWSIVTGTGGSFGNVSLHNSTFIGTAGTSYTLRWTISNNPCNASTSDVNVTFNEFPIISASTAFSACEGGSLVLSASGAGGVAPFTYSWSGPNGTITPVTNSTITITTTAGSSDAGTYSVIVTDANGCSAVPASVNVSVHALPYENISITGTNPICNGSSTTIGVFIVGEGNITGTLSDGTPFSGFIDPQDGFISIDNIIVSPTGNTTYQVATLHDGFCDADPSILTDPQNSVDVIVNPSPTVSIAPPATMELTCAVTSINLLATGNGDSYSWSTNETGISINVSLPGTYIVTATSVNGCTDTASIVITQDIAVTTGITNNSGTTVLTCSATSINVTATGGISYIWDGGISAATAANSFNAPGTYTVTVTAANGCTDVASIIITQDIAVTAGITNNSGTTVLTCAVISISVTATAGVSYSWDGGTSTAAAANSFTTPGTYSVTVTAANGCTDVASIVITQDIAVTAGITNNSGTTVLTCSANSISVTATGGVSYVWDGGTSAATTANNFNAPGTYTVIVTAANGCTDVASIVITQDISTPDVSNISGDFTKTCSVNTSGAEIGEANDASATYLWSPSAGLSSATVSNPTANPTVTTTYTVIKTSNANGCSATATITVTVNGTTLNVSVNNSGPVCPGSDITLTSNATDGVSPYAYSWSGPNSTIDPVANPTITSATTLDVGTYSVIVSDANGCSATASTIVSLLPLPNPSGVITGPYVVCAATSGVTFTAGSVPGAISYLWSSSTTSISIVSGQGTNEIVANFANSWAVGFLTVVPFNQCGADTLGTSIHMRSVPGTPSLISGPTFVCVNSSGTYSVNPMPNYSNSFSWSVPAGMSITSGQGTNSITVSTISSWSQGTISVHAVNSCGSGVDRILIVRSVPNQPGLIVGPGIICKNSSANYSVANVLGATSYTWVAPSGMSITAGQSTNSVSVSTSNTWTSGTISVTASGICGSSTARTFALKSIPSVPGVINGQSTGICQGSSANYSVVSTNGVVYSWIAPTGASIAAGQGSNMVSINYSLSFPSSGTVSVYGTNDCGASGARSLNVSGTGSTPSAPGTITTNTIGGICPGENRTYSVSPVGGITYSWTVPSGASILSGQTSNQISVDYLVTFTASGNISVIAINSCGNSPSTSLAASLGTVPSVPGTINVDISGGICPVDTRNYSIATVANATGYTWSAPGGATINTGQGTNSINLTYDVTFTTGDISVTASNNCGSSLPKTLSVSLGSTPSAPASIVSNIPGTVCPGDSRTYSISSPIAGVTYNWTIPAGGGITSGQGNSSIDVAYDDNFVSTGSVSVTAQNNCGTSGATSRIVIHGPAPANPGTIVTNIPGSVCSGESRDYSVPFVSGISYNWAAPQASNIVSGQGTNVITVLYTSGSPTPDSVKVTASDYCGSSSSTFIVNLSSSPGQPGSVSGATLVCQNSSQSYSVPSVGGVTYNWTAPSGASISTGQGTNTINVNFSSTFTAAGDLIVNTSNGCGQSIDQTLNIDFNNSGFASGPISGPSSVCIGSIYSYSVLQMNGVTYTWIAPSGASILAGQGSRSVSVKFPAAYTSAGNLSVTTSTGCGSIATTLNITPSTTPAQPSIISGVSVACNGYQITYSVASIANATSYIWTIPAGSSGSSSTNSILVTYGPTFTGGYVSVKASNACGTGLTRTKGITTGTAPAQPGAIAGVSLVCNGSYTYSVATVAGASSYAWTLPSGSSGISTTNSIAVTYDNTFTGGSLGVASVACGSSAVRTLAVSLGSTPSPASSITGSASQCAGATGVYSVTYVNGVTYNWTAPVGASIASGQGTNAATVSFSGTFTAAGNLNVTAGNGCGQSSPSTLNIASNNSGPGLGAITGNNLPCLGTTNVYSVTSVSGLIYNWTAPSGATILSGQGSNSVSVKFTTSFTVAANLSVSANTICGTSNVSLNITPNSAPVQPSLIAGTSTVCNNNSQVTYSVASIANANTYLWTLPSGSSGSSSNNNITVTYGTSFAGGYLSVKASNGCGTGLTRSKGITLAANCGARQLSGDASTDIEEAISVYPNPATEQVTVSFNSHAFTQYHLSLVDMMGREVVSRNGTAVEGVNTVDMNLSSVAKGYYLVHLVSGNSDKIVRMVVE